MRKSQILCLLFFVIFIVFSSTAFADNLTCQYKEKIPSEKLVMAPFDSNGTRLSEIRINLPGNVDTPLTSIIAEDWSKPLIAINPNPVDLRINLDILVEGVHSANPNRELCNFRERRTFDFTASAFGSARVEPLVDAPAGCDWLRFVKDYSITYIETEGVSVKSAPAYYNESCKLCNGKICLNDGEKCQLNSECGSTICNNMDVCGPTKIVECTNGRKDCNNQSCVEPSVKKTGEAYSCDFECESGRGENGVCLLCRTIPHNRLFPN